MKKSFVQTCIDLGIGRWVSEHQAFKVEYGPEKNSWFQIGSSLLSGIETEWASIPSVEDLPRYIVGENAKERPSVVAIVATLLLESL